MKAVILAAGIGSRIRPLTDNTHKSLLEVAGKSILQRMLENIQAVGITEVVVITGYREDDVKEFIASHFPNLQASFKKNEKYLETNTGYSLLLTREFVEGDDFVKFDADVVFEKEVLGKLLASQNSALCIDRNIHLEAEEVKVITDSAGRVLQVGKKLDPQASNGESIGIEKITKDAGRVLFGELDSLMKDQKNWQEYYDDSYTTLVEKGVPFEAVDITGLKWVEIDTHEDFKRAQETFA
ncbi:MAG: sugar phosphate nucleotidyltransferase [Candidatus Levyibacteriota bacterium]